MYKFKIGQVARSKDSGLEFTVTKENLNVFNDMPTWYELGILHNPEALRKVRDVIAQEESEIHMGPAFHVWLSQPEIDTSVSPTRTIDRPSPDCGSPGCIAGWTIHLKYKDGLNTDHMRDPDWTPTQEAGEILGLTHEDGYSLFYLKVNSNIYHWQFDRLVNSGRRKEIVLRQLDAILDGYPVDWKKHWTDVDPDTINAALKEWSDFSPVGSVAVDMDD